MKIHLESRILACERENARLRKLIFRQNFFWIIVLLLIGGAAVAGTDIKDATFGTITAKEVAVVDAKGVVRARLGGDLPDAVIAGGKVAERGSKAAGLIIYDEEGIERGGYVTQDTGSNAMLTLDSKYKQAVLLVAGPSSKQTSALKLWTQESSIELRSDLNGSRISVNDKYGVVLQQPVIKTLPPSTCARYQELELKYPNEGVCQSRFVNSACMACLNSK